MSTLIDVADVPACLCNAHLDDMAKAVAEGPDESIWTPHENPFLTAHVEVVTERLAAITQRIQDDFSRALLGEPLGDMAKAEGQEHEPWLRWDKERFKQAQAYLEGKPSSEYSLDDWLLLAEFIVHRYCPEGLIGSIAEYLTLRATILGKIQASAIKLSATPREMAALVDLVPTSFAHVPPRLLTPTETATIRVAKARAGESIALAMDSAKHRMKTVIVEHVQAQILGQKEGNSQHLRTRLFDNFGTLNRDFRRIAVTESGECCNQGFVAASLGRRVRRLEAYRHACSFCKGISGHIYNVVDANAPKRDGQSDVWEGKTNIGRSASLRKRGPSGLIERGPGELWWPAAGVQHPHCRGSWTPVVDRPANVSADFHDWMTKRLSEAIPSYRSPSNGSTAGNELDDATEAGS